MGSLGLVFIYVIIERLIISSLIHLEVGLLRFLLSEPHHPFPQLDFQSLLGLRVGVLPLPSLLPSLLPLPLPLLHPHPLHLPHRRCLNLRPLAHSEYLYRSNFPQVLCRWPPFSSSSTCTASTHLQQPPTSYQ